MKKYAEESIEVGMKIGSLTVMEKAEDGGLSASMWNVRCDCGRELIAAESALKTHYLRFCGLCTTGSHKDMSGQRFGKMTLIRRVENNEFGKIAYLCHCDCGNDKVETVSYLKQFHYPNCGCETMKQISEARTIHGLDKHLLTPIWRAMLSRCVNPQNKDFKHYGGRGIKVCERWHELATFIADMEESYGAGLQLDRIDNNGPYAPDNCRWVTQRENAKNKRNNRKIVSMRGIKTLAEQAEITQVPYYTITRRIKHGVPEVFSSLPKSYGKMLLDTFKGSMPDKDGLERAVRAAEVQAKAIDDWGFGPVEIELG